MGAVGLAIRHPELGSGSIWPVGLRGQAKAGREVVPIGVFALDQADFPCAMPAFELFFAGDRLCHVGVGFEADEGVNGVAGGEARGGRGAVLVQAGDEVAGDADVQGAARLAGEDVDAEVAVWVHRAVFGAEWTLKQVQGDGGGSGDDGVRATDEVRVTDGVWATVGVCVNAGFRIDDDR